MDSHQRWERVLAAIEAEARRAEALLAAQSEESVVVEAVPSEPVAVPADWLLLAPGEVPAELRDRIVELQERVAALQAGLARALREWTPRSPLPDPGARAPIFIDTAL